MPTFSTPPDVARLVFTEVLDLQTVRDEAW
jgi:hypothetical protein